jgi:hypothetical protein
VEIKKECKKKRGNKQANDERYWHGLPVPSDRRSIVDPKSVAVMRERMATKLVGYARDSLPDHVCVKPFVTRYWEPTVEQKH